MTTLRERIAVRLFWKAEHLDPSADGDVPENEWFRDEFPDSLDKRRQQFWRYLADEALHTLAEALGER